MVLFNRVTLSIFFKHIHPGRAGIFERSARWKIAWCIYWRLNSEARKRLGRYILHPPPFKPAFQKSLLRANGVRLTAENEIDIWIIDGFYERPVLKRTARAPRQKRQRMVRNACQTRGGRHAYVAPRRKMRKVHRRTPNGPFFAIRRNVVHRAAARCAVRFFNKKRTARLGRGGVRETQCPHGTENQKRAREKPAHREVLRTVVRYGI